MEPSDSFEVILNPAASSGRGAEVRPRLEAAFRSRGIQPELYLTKAPRHAFELARAASERGVQRLLVVGGDGTLHEVANGLLSLARPRPAVAICPVGTGNDFHRMTGADRTLSHSVDLLRYGDVRAFDVGKATFGGRSSFFVNVLGLGIDVAVLERRERFGHLHGLWQYLAALPAALASFRPIAVRITFAPGAGRKAQESLVTRTLLTIVTVGPSVGGGFLVNPDASPYDGLLDLMIVEPLGITKVIRYIPKVMGGRHQGLPELLQRRISTMTVTPDDGKALFLEMDGERVPDPVERLVVDVLPGALNVLVGRDRAG